eukprot:3068702-Heterocapsa_arctica.AAC.1
MNGDEVMLVEWDAHLVLDLGPHIGYCVVVVDEDFDHSTFEGRDALEMDGDEMAGAGRLLLLVVA